MRVSKFEIVVLTVVVGMMVAVAIGVIEDGSRPRREPNRVEVAARWAECGGRVYPEPGLRIEPTADGNPWADHATWEVVIDPFDDDLRGDLRGDVAHEFAHLTAFVEEGYAASYDGAPYFERRHYEVRKCLGLEP